MHKILGIVMIGLIGLAGCIPTASVQSNRDYSYTKLPQKVFVLSKAGRDGELDYRSFESAFELEASKCGVKALVSTMHSLDLRPNAHLTLLESYQPDAVLTIRAAGGTKQGGRVTEVTYDAVLYESKDEQIIWRGSVHFEPGDMLEGQGGEVLAGAIVGQLRADGLFPRCLSVPWSPEEKPAPAPAAVAAEAR